MFHISCAFHFFIIVFLIIGVERERIHRYVYTEIQQLFSEHTRLSSLKEGEFFYSSSGGRM